MSDIKFACIHCGQRLSCGHTLAGQRLTCPACQRSVLVPWMPSGPEASKASSASQESPALSEAHELPNVSIPKLSLPEVAPRVAGSAHTVLQLQGRKRDVPGLSIWAVLSFILSFLGPFGFLPAIICGHIAKWQMRRNSALRGSSLATAGMAIAYTSALLTGVFVARTLLRRL